MQTAQTVAQKEEARVVEPPRVRHLLIYYFLQGLALSLFFVVAFSLFLSSFVAADLPGAFVVSAGAVFVIGRIYDLIVQKVSMRKRAPLLGLVALFVIALYLGTQLWASTLLPFMLFIGYRLLFTFSDLEFWSLSNLFFETREAKSLFGWINMRDIPARMLGFFSVGFLVQVVELNTLLLISALLFLLSAIVLYQLLDPRYAKESRLPTAEENKTSIFRFDGKWLLLLLCALAFVVVIIFSVANFTFLSLIEDRVHRAADLARYLGIVFGVASLFTAIGKTLLTNKILEKIGATVAMLSFPVFIIIIAGIVSLHKGVGHEDYYLTYFILLLAGGKVFRDSLYMPVFLSLTQPLSAHIRQRSYIFIKTVAEPFGLAAAGVIIYYFIRRPQLPDFETAALVELVLGILAAILVFASFRRYIYAFRQAMIKRNLVTRAIDSFNSYSQSIIKEKLNSRNPDDVIYAYKICSEANTHFFEMEPDRLLRHEADKVRLYALQQMSVDTPFSDTDILIQLSINDPSPEVRQAAVEHLGARYKDSFADEYNALLENPDPKLREAALRGLMESGNPEIIMIAGQKLNDLIASPRHELNIMAASIIGDIKLQSHYKHLQKYFDHSDVAVRKAAIVAAGKLVNPQLLAALFSLLGDAELEEEVLQAIAAYKNIAVSYLQEYTDVIKRFPEQVLRLCTLLDDNAAARIIAVNLLPVAETTLLDECLQVLHNLKVDKIDADRGVVELKLVNAGLLIYTSCYYIDTLDNNALMLKEALEAEVRNAKRRMLLLLSLMYDKKTFSKIVSAYDMAGNNTAQLVSLLDATLDANHKKRFLPVYELEDCGELKTYLAQFYQQQITADVSDAILLGEKKSKYLPWTQAAALYTDLLVLSDEVLSRYEDHKEEMVTEMVKLALSRKPFVLRMVGDDSSGSFGADVDGDPLLKIERILVLKSIPIFEHFTQDMLSEISGIMIEQRFKTNEMVYREGEPGNSIYIIYYGAVSMYNGIQEIMQQGGKEVFVKIDTDDQKMASAKAQSDTLLFRINKDDIVKLGTRRPDIATNMLGLFTTV